MNDFILDIRSADRDVALRAKGISFGETVSKMSENMDRRGPGLYNVDCRIKGGFIKSLEVNDEEAANGKCWLYKLKRVDEVGPTGP